MQLQGIADQLEELGYQILAISPDSPEDLKRTSKEHGLGYPLLSDSDLKAARAFGIGFQVPGKRGLPVPAVYIAGADRMVRFQYVNPNYRVRLDLDVLQAAAKAALRN